MITRSSFYPARPMQFGITKLDKDEQPTVKVDQNQMDNKMVTDLAIMYGLFGGTVGSYEEASTLKPGDSQPVEILGKGLLGGSAVGVSVALLVAFGVKAVRRILR
ncbi:MAG TPA: hypothetical protein V6C52_03135 [Coleofasciculaceae cyanobacterium]|jgi:hypothetical protein